MHLAHAVSCSSPLIALRECVCTSRLTNSLKSLPATHRLQWCGTIFFSLYLLYAYSRVRRVHGRDSFAYTHASARVCIFAQDNFILEAILQLLDCGSRWILKLLENSFTPETMEMIHSREMCFSKRDARAQKSQEELIHLLREWCLLSHGSTELLIFSVPLLDWVRADLGVQFFSIWADEANSAIAPTRGVCRPAPKMYTHRGVRFQQDFPALDPLLRNLRWKVTQRNFPLKWHSSKQGQ